MISVSQLTFTYDNKHTFSFPDLQCEAGQGLLITGTSGKGKTTLLHLLSGLLHPKSGNVTINTQDIYQLSNAKLDQFRGKNMGLILQKSHFVEALSVLENVEVASWLISKQKNSAKAKQLLAQLGLEDHTYKLPSALSVGQQQRVNIARALINEPQVILADEPTSSLDDENALIVGNLLKDLAQQYNAALLVVTHDQRLKDLFSNQIELI